MVQLTRNRRRLFCNDNSAAGGAIARWTGIPARRKSSMTQRSVESAQKANCSSQQQHRVHTSEKDTSDRSIAVATEPHNEPTITLRMSDSRSRIILRCLPLIKIRNIPQWHRPISPGQGFGDGTRMLFLYDRQLLNCYVPIYALTHCLINTNTARYHRTPLMVVEAFYTTAKMLRTSGMSDTARFRWYCHIQANLQ
jgi:hypothetical protein